MLVHAGALVNVASDNGVTPLHVAVQEGNAELVELLVGNAAQIDAMDDDGNHAVHLAAK